MLIFKKIAQKQVKSTKLLKKEVCNAEKITTFATPTGWYHSSVGREKDLKSLCRWFDYSWYHRTAFRYT